MFHYVGQYMNFNLSDNATTLTVTPSEIEHFVPACLWHDREFSHYNHDWPPQRLSVQTSRAV